MCSNGSATPTSGPETRDDRIFVALAAIRSSDRAAARVAQIGSASGLAPGTASASGLAPGTSPPRGQTVRRQARTGPARGPGLRQALIGPARGPGLRQAPIGPAPQPGLPRVHDRTSVAAGVAGAEMSLLHEAAEPERRLEAEARARAVAVDAAADDGDDLAAKHDVVPFWSARQRPGLPSLRQKKWRRRSLCRPDGAGTGTDRAVSGRGGLSASGASEPRSRCPVAFGCGHGAARIGGYGKCT